MSGLNSEMNLLKEMVRASKVQVKGRDTDIQRLNIKIKRLEKTNDMREQMINKVADNLQLGKEIDPGMLGRESNLSAMRESHRTFITDHAANVERRNNLTKLPPIGRSLNRSDRADS